MTVTYKDILFENEYAAPCADLPVPPSITKLLYRENPMGHWGGIQRREAHMFANTRPTVSVEMRNEGMQNDFIVDVDYVLENNDMLLQANNMYYTDGETDQSDSAEFYTHAYLKQTHALSQPIGVSDGFQGEQTDANVYKLTTFMNSAVEVLDEIDSQPHPITIAGVTHFESLDEACVLAAVVRNHGEKPLQEVFVAVTRTEGEAVDFGVTRYDVDDEVRMHVKYDINSRTVDIFTACRPAPGSSVSTVNYMEPRLGDYPLANVAVIEHYAQFKHESLPDLWSSLDAELSECINHVNTHGRHHGLLTEDGLAHLGKLAEEPFAKPTSDDLLDDLEPEQPSFEPF